MPTSTRTPKPARLPSTSPHTAVDPATDTYQATKCGTAPRRVLVDILLHPGQYYVNVHTVLFPGGGD
jgi:hypothetical protein